MSAANRIEIVPQDHENMYAAFDTALTRLAPYGPNLSNGMTGHAPMVAETLCVLRRPEAVEPYLDRHTSLLLPRSPTSQKITAGNWQSALGDSRRAEDWSRYFYEQLQDHGLATVLDRWVLRLAPGISAAAAHGVIRTGHALRAFTHQPSPLRLRELADGLSLWATDYQELPGTIGTPARLNLTSLDAAMRHVSLVPISRRRFDGTIVGALRALDEHPDFRGVMNLIDFSGDPLIELAALTEHFARIFIANAHDALTAIVFVHAVTGSAALLPFLPYLSRETAATALRYSWQAGCGLFATFGTTPDAPPINAPVLTPELRTAWIDQAIATGDDHGIKFTGTCLSEYDRTGSPVFLQAIPVIHNLLRPV